MRSWIVRPPYVETIRCGMKRAAGQQHVESAQIDPHRFLTLQLRRHLIGVEYPPGADDPLQVLQIAEPPQSRIGISQQLVDPEAAQIVLLVAAGPRDHLDSQSAYVILIADQPGPFELALPGRAVLGACHGPAR